MRQTLVALYVGMSFGLFPAITHAQAAADEAIRTGHWTQAEVKEYQDCVAKLDATKKADDTTGSSVWCEVWEERMHWSHVHPGVVKGLPSKAQAARGERCNRTHAADMNGTPQQFWAATDQCLREEYGLPVAPSKTK